MHPDNNLPIILASTSRYRRALLERLGLQFSVSDPGVVETPLPGERPEELATRLAYAKAVAVANKHPRSLIIGSDQVAVLGSQILSKPGNYANAYRQLQQLSGMTAHFLTAVCVYHTGTGKSLIILILLLISSISASVL